MKLKKLISMTVLAMLLASVLSNAFNVRVVRSDYLTTTPIYILPDGSISPSSAPIQRNGNIYTLTGDITIPNDANASAIIVQRSNITIDGAEHIVQGSKDYSTGYYYSYGLNLTSINHVTIKNTRITNFTYSMYLGNSLYCNILGNNITYSCFRGDCAIWLNSASNYSTVSCNIIANSLIGIGIISSFSNLIYHNNFVNDSFQVASNNIDNSTNSWDNGYPSGGNYWGYQVGADSYSGPYQNLTGSDGISDTSYVIYPPYQHGTWSDVDNYPLMHPWKPGDATYDGKVNVLDLIFIATRLGTRNGDLSWSPRADVNEDNVINVLDLIICATHLGQHW